MTYFKDCDEYDINELDSEDKRIINFLDYIVCEYNDVMDKIIFENTDENSIISKINIEIMEDFKNEINEYMNGTKREIYASIFESDKYIN